MNKIKEIIDQNQLTEYQVTRFTGQPSRTDALRSVANGEREITSINLNLLTSYARGLGLRLQDLLADYELDGTSSQIINIKKYIDKYKRLNEPGKEFVNGGYIISKGIDSQEYELKTEYEFLIPEQDHSHQTTNDIYLLNNAYLPILRDNKANRNKTLAKLANKFINKTKSIIVYSPLPDGADIKIIGYVYDTKDKLMFTEIIGCEFIDKEDNKTICYYKAHSDKFIKPSQVNRIEKEEMSELEFYQGLNHQSRKFNIYQ